MILSAADIWLNSESQIFFSFKQSVAENPYRFVERDGESYKYILSVDKCRIDLLLLAMNTWPEAYIMSLLKTEPVVIDHLLKVAPSLWRNVPIESRSIGMSIRAVNRTVLNLRYVDPTHYDRVMTDCDDPDTIRAHVGWLRRPNIAIRQKSPLLKRLQKYLLEEDSSFAEAVTPDVVDECSVDWARHNPLYVKYSPRHLHELSSDPIRIAQTIKMVKDRPRTFRALDYGMRGVYEIALAAIRGDPRQYIYIKGELVDSVELSLEAVYLMPSLIRVVSNDKVKHCLTVCAYVYRWDPTQFKYFGVGLRQTPGIVKMLKKRRRGFPLFA